jgi:hypothetical protein
MIGAMHVTRGSPKIKLRIKLLQLLYHVVLPRFVVPVTHTCVCVFAIEPPFSKHSWMIVLSSSHASIIERRSLKLKANIRERDEEGLVLISTHVCFMMTNEHPLADHD